MSKQQAIARHHKQTNGLQEEIHALVKTIESDHPNEIESIAELIFNMDCKIESLEYKITMLKQALRKIQETNQHQKIQLDSATAEGVTALVAKRRTHGDYSHIHARFMDNARDDVIDFFKEIGLQVGE